MKSSLLAILALLFFSPALARAQELSPLFNFSREANSAGSIDYILKPVVEEIQKKFGEDKPFQIVAAVARVEAGRAVLMFANAQKESQLYNQSERSVVIKADSAEIKVSEYALLSKDEDSSRPVKLEIVGALISFKELQKIIKASAVTVKFGSVIYKLDQDNINALHFMAAEIEKDQKKAK